VALSPPASAAPARRDTGSGGIGIQLMQGQKGREKDPRAHRYIVDHLKPGTTVRRKLRVVNGSPERQQIEVYPAAATLDKETFVFGVDREPSELTSWVSVDKVKLDLKPGAEAVVMATVAVPPAASAGERYGVIWASARSDPRKPGAISQISRIGIRIYLDIGKGGEPRSDFTIGDFVPARSTAGDPSLAVAVTNTGGRALDLTGTADFSDGPAGERVGPFKVTSTATLAPGASGTVVLAFPRALRNGPWKAKVTLKSGLVSRSATGLITFPDPGTAGRPATRTSLLSSPWVIAGGALLICLVLFGALFLLARRHRGSRIAG
jgi:hypothetical protein